MEDVVVLFVTEGKFELLISLWKLSWIARKRHVQEYITKHLPLIAKGVNLPATATFRELAAAHDKRLFQTRAGTNEKKFAYFTSIRHFPLMRYCRLYCVSSYRAAKKAARIGEPKLVEFFVRQKNSFQEREAMLNGTAKGGHLDLIKRMKRKGDSWPDEICIQAAKGGSLEVLRWLNIERGRPMTIDVCRAASRYGHIAVLEWAITNLCPVDRKCAEKAAKGGHVAVLEMLSETGLRIGEETINQAAFHGHLPVVKWCVARGTPYTSETHLKALRGGHIPVLEFGLERGVPLPKPSFNNAIESENIQLLEWLEKRGFPHDDDSSSRAAFEGSLPVLEWLVERNCAWNECACLSAAFASFATLMWVLEHGCPWDERVYQTTIKFSDEQLEALSSAGYPKERGT